MTRADNQDNLLVAHSIKLSEKKMNFSVSLAQQHD